MSFLAERGCVSSPHRGRMCRHIVDTLGLSMDLARCVMEAVLTKDRSCRGDHRGSGRPAHGGGWPALWSFLCQDDLGTKSGTTPMSKADSPQQGYLGTKTERNEAKWPLSCCFAL